VGGTYPYDAKQKTEKLISTLRTLTNRDPEQEVQQGFGVVA
jgi:hypothetical protein